MPRPAKIKEEEFTDLWKKTRGNVSEIARILNTSFRTALRMKQKLESEGKLKSKQEIKPSEVAPVIDDFNQLPEVSQCVQWYLGRGKSPKTVDRMREVLKLLWLRLGKKRPITFTADDVLKVIAQYRAEGKRGSLFKMAVGARAFFRFLAYTDQLDGNTFTKYMQILETTGLKTEPQLIFLEKEEFDRFHQEFLKLCDSDYDRALYDAVNFVKVSTGMRTGDPNPPFFSGISGLQMSMLRIINGQAIFDGVREKGRGGAGKIWNDVRPSPIACEKLIAYLQLRQKLGIESKYVFCMANGSPLDLKQYRKIFKTAAKNAGITKNITPHTLRHCFLTWMIDSGIPLEVATDINVGWEDLNTAKKFYLGRLNRKKEDALKSLWNQYKI